MLVAISAMFISLCALAATIYEANLERENQLLSVWPRLQVGWVTGEQYQIKVENKGLGPALIKSSEITFDGKPVTDWGDILEQLKINSSLTTRSIYGSILSADEEAILFSVEEIEPSRILETENNRIGLEICYCSVYEDCWKVNRAAPAVEVEVCE